MSSPSDPVMVAETATLNGDVPAARRGRTVVRTPTAREIDPSRFRRRRRRLERGLAWATPVALILLWQWASSAEMIDPRFFPSPTDIWSAGLKSWRDGLLVDNATASFSRVAWGFTLGCGTGIICGIPLGLSRLARAASEPLVYALWTVPKLALLPLLLLIFGLNEKPIVILIAINCFFLVLIPTMAAVRSVPESYREAAVSFRASRWDMLRHVILPAATPQIFVALRLAAGASILVMVGAEFVQARKGLGHLIWNSWSLFLADRMYVGIVVVAVSGALFTMFIGWVGRRLAPWDDDV
jgi:ABC-type nitrate/sulfonate/bicarbonate transport system permease component